MAMLIFSGPAAASAALCAYHASPLLLSVALAEQREVSPLVEGHATNSWPPLKTMKLLIQDARLVH